MNQIKALDRLKQIEVYVDGANFDDIDAYILANYAECIDNVYVTNVLKVINNLRGSGIDDKGWLLLRTVLLENSKHPSIRIIGGFGLGGGYYSACHINFGDIAIAMRKLTISYRDFNDILKLVFEL